MNMQHLFSNTHFLGTLVALLALTLKGKLWQIKTNSVRNMTFSVIFKHCDEPTKNVSSFFMCCRSDMLYWKCKILQLSQESKFLDGVLHAFHHALP